MDRARMVMVTVVVVLVLGVSPALADEWRFPLGISYANGWDDIVQLYEDNINAEGYTAERTDGVPVGIVFQPYYQWDSGLGFGAGVGPLMAMGGDREFYNVPVNLSARYALMQESDISVMFRAGASYHIAGGDYVERSNVGALVAVGVEFFRTKKVGVGAEVGYDSATVTFDDRRNGNQNDTKDIKPVGFFVSVFAVF